jgi:signal transduction histidine kinase
MSKKKLRVLYVEDSDFDADLVEAQLGLQEFEPDIVRVETASEMEVALGERIFDVILADYNLPTFSAAAALSVMQKASLDYPFIVVSGTIGEKRAVEILRAGAQDFISKGDFARLIPAIRRELADAESREVRRSVEKALSVSEDNFRELANAMPQLVWVITDRRFEYLNAKWLAYFGADMAGDLEIENWISRCVHVDDLEAARAVFLEAREGFGEDFELELRLKNQRGAYRWFLARGVSSVAGATVQKIFGTFTDIEDAKKKAADELAAKARAAAENAELYRKAEAANQAKSDFLANMSHEIRTPLGAILGFTDLLSDGSTSEEERRECVEIIKRNGKQLARLIDEILDLTKVESQRLDLETIEFSLRELIQDLSSLLVHEAEKKGLQFSFDCAPSVPDRFISDPNRLRQILINLIGNAVKFTSAGWVKVSVSLSEGLTGKQLEFIVSDSGIGLTEEQAAKLFQPFMQADSSMTRRFGGTGLGLALSRRLARALGGDVTILKTRLGEGSSFVLKIPATLAALAQATDGSLSNVSSELVNSDELPLAGRRILVVDDSPDNRLLVSRYLTKAGAVVDTADDGKSGAEKALAGSYEIVLMDLQMPGVDGLKALRLLQEAGYQKPVIALTAHTMQGDRERCLKAGFSSHLSKPIDAPLMISLLSRL